jgi:hypothetical protein
VITGMLNALCARCFRACRAARIRIRLLTCSWASFDARMHIVHIVWLCASSLTPQKPQAISRSTRFHSLTRKGSSTILSRSINGIPIRKTKSASLRPVWIARAKSWLLSRRFAVRKSVSFPLAALRYGR